MGGLQICKSRLRMGRNKAAIAKERWLLFFENAKFTFRSIQISVRCT